LLDEPQRRFLPVFQSTENGVHQQRLGMTEAAKLYTEAAVGPPAPIGKNALS